MTKSETASWFARALSVSGKMAIVAALVLLAFSATAPNAHAGALWGGFGSPIFYNYYAYPYYGGNTYVYQPYPYYFGFYPYYGYARDYTYFYAYAPYYVRPWLWGFWDPPATPQLTDTIQYAEIFAGLDSGNNLIPLDGLNVSSSTVSSDVDNHIINGTIINGTADEIIAAIDPSDRSRVSDLLSAYIGNDTAQFSAALYTGEIRDFSIPSTPEPGSIALFGTGGLLMFAGLWRRRRRPSPLSNSQTPPR